MTLRLLFEATMHSSLYLFLLLSMCCDWKSPTSAAGMCLRFSFGASLLLMGVIHYTTMTAYTSMVSDGLGPISFLGTIVAYILPALMIVGGALVAIGRYMQIGAWCAGLSLAIIGPGLLLKPMLSGASVVDVMPYLINTFVWVLLYYFSVKSACCCGGSTSKK